MDRKRKPGIYLLTDAGDAVELILVWLDGRETRLQGQSPAEELVSFTTCLKSAVKCPMRTMWISRSRRSRWRNSSRRSRP